MGLLQAPVVDASNAEGLRRYLSDPNTHISRIRCEPEGPSGRFRVIIMLEISDFL